MCLILFALDCHADYRLVLAANRDEFYDRPAAPAGFWPDAPAVLAGRDLVGGGTWLGMTRSGRWAAVANIRDPADRRQGTPSRGALPVGFLRGSEPPEIYLRQVARAAARYKGFNLLAGDGDRLACLNSREERVRPLPPGLYGLSNAALDTPWPKVTGGKAALDAVLARPGPVDPELLFALLADTSAPPEEELPDTGVGPEWERLLAPRFIAGPGYGTRASTVILIRRDGAASFIERTFDPSSRRRPQETRFDFPLAPAETPRPGK